MKLLSAQFVYVARAAAPLLVGLSLLAAGGLKAFALATGPVGGAGLTASRPVASAAAVWEVLVGGAIVFGWRRTVAVRAALATFLVFAAYSAVSVLEGRRSCGCLGLVSVSPAVMLSADLGCVVLLLLGHPLGTEGRGAERGPVGTALKSNNPSHRWAVVPLAAVTAAVAAAVAVGFLAAHPLQAASGVRFEKPDHDFGYVPATSASVLSHRFPVRNAGSRAVTFDAVQTSCGCTSVELPKEPLMPGDAADVALHVNWSDREGPQRAEVWFNSSDGSAPKTAHRLALSANVLADVAPVPDDALTAETPHP